MDGIRVECEDRSCFGAAFRDMPDVPVDELVGVRSALLRHFVFYRRDRGRVWGRCSCCGAEILAYREHEDSGDLLEDLWRAKHGEKGRCPSCRQEIKFMAAGRFRDFSTLSVYDNVIFILPINNGQTVFFRAYTVFADYSDERAARLCFVEKAHYRLSPGEWVMERRSFPIYDYIRFNTLAYHKGHYLYDCYVGPWKARKTPSEPWQGYMWNTMNYWFSDMKKLDDTFLKYSRVMEFDRVRPKRGQYMGYWGSQGPTKLMAYLCYYTKYPALEIAMRTNGREAARDLVYLGLRNSRVVNWRAKNPLQFWRLTKEEYRATEHVSDRLEFLRDCAEYSRRLPICDLVQIWRDGERNVNAFFAVLDLLPGEDPQRVLRYCQHHSNQYIGYYRDYLEAARDVGRDLGVHNVRFPKDLTAAHDEAVAARNWMREQKQNAAWSKLAEKYKVKDIDRRTLYNFADGEYFVRVAESGAEIVAEGNALHHCVGGYVDRHITCKTTILFLRKAAEPDKPFYTVEMRGAKLQQVHGDRNCAIEGEAKVFFDRWLVWVDRGGGLVKQRKKETSAKTKAAERKAV